MANTVVEQPFQNRCRREDARHSSDVVEVQDDLLVTNLHGNRRGAVIKTRQGKFRVEMPTANFGPESLQQFLQVLGLFWSLFVFVRLQQLFFYSHQVITLTLSFVVKQNPQSQATKLRFQVSGVRCQGKETENQVASSQ